MTTLALLPEFFVAGGLAVAGAAAVSIPVAIHLLTRLRRQRQPWAAMRFLIEAFRRQRQRLRFEQLLLLLVRCLIVLVLGLALAGPLLTGWLHIFGGGNSGRVVCLVIDDALSSQARVGDQRTRFENLIADAGRIVDALGPFDRVALWTTARPVTALVDPPTGDLALVRRTLAGLQSRAGRSDWPAALSAVNSTLAEKSFDSDRVTIFLLGDFSAGALDVARPAPARLAALGGRGQIIVSRPAPSVPNYQIESLTPFRSMILAEEGIAPTAQMEIKLRRFTGDAGPASGTVSVDLLGQDPFKPLASARQDFRWSTGQSSALINLDVPIPSSWFNSESGATGAGQPLVLRASLQTAGEDALPLDNARYALVQFRRHLEIGLIDDAATEAAPETLRPRDWLNLVLAPPSPKGAAGGDTNHTMELSDIAPAAVDGDALAHFDAVMVLRPDLLGAPAWTALKTFAQRGGLIWIFTPPTDAPARWTAALHDQLGLNWQIGLAARSAGDGPDAGWRLVIDSPTPPEPLELLSTGWQALLRPLVVRRKLDLATRGGQESQWLQVADSGSAANSNVLLAEAPVGEGHVLFLATALDADWSNLTTKPLFPPLMHEALRGVLGSGLEAARLNALVCGDQPALGPQWEGTLELQQWDEHKTVPVLRNEQSLAAAEPMETPGIYMARPNTGLRLAVNPDSDAGNTQALDPAVLGQWLNGLGTWNWFDEDAPASALLSGPPRTSLGWPLLWLTLGLVLLETYLARAFSHAQVPNRAQGTGNGEDAPLAPDVLKESPAPSEEEVAA